MLNIDIKELENNLFKYAKLIEEKEEKEIIITRGEKPILVLSPYRKRVFGCAKGKISIPDNYDDIDIDELFED